MAKRTVYHIVPTDKGWSLERQGDNSDWRFYATKREAVQEGRQIAASQEPAQLIIHDERGRIEEERTYGDDPRNIRG